MAVVMLLSAWLPACASIWQAAEQGRSRTDQLTQEICSSTGLARSSNRVAPGEDQHQAVGQHCPYCHLHAQGLGLPPSPLAFVTLPLQHEAPALFWQGPRTLRTWAAPRARAPPTRS
ncbi:DUF2946 domain-containing protein [Aquabacterium sp.]|uniref:DUF2946 domain-containing protein n=1 Tax=Aquabacterium sp. TaxID=1872578 RepID=UPI0039C86B8A